jgi:hypothetical protein
VVLDGALAVKGAGPAGDGPGRRSGTDLGDSHVIRPGIVSVLKAGLQDGYSTEVI